MTTYTLNIIIDDAMLAAGSSDSLCIAKKVLAFTDEIQAPLS
jgi:hypothetical protein